MVVTFEIILLVFVLGTIIGIISSLSGTGGGTMYVPLIVLLFLYPINIAIGTSTFVIMISSGAGFFSYIKNKETNLKLALIFASFSLLGSILCTILFQLLFPISNEMLKIVFIIVSLLAGLLMLNKAKKEYSNVKNDKQFSSKEKRMTDFNYKKDLPKSILLFILGGFVINLLGIGGGIVNTPSLHLIIGFSIHNSVAISTSIIFFTSIYNSFYKIFLGVVEILIGIFIALGSVLGAIIGAKYLKRVPKSFLQFFIAIVQITLSILMFI
ncbi:MAG: sulfite exporter TauE/SafE family protein [Promethearchaeota archaeon]